MLGGSRGGSSLLDAEKFDATQSGKLASDDRGAAPGQTGRGGQAVVEKYGREHMAEIGRKGSHAVVRKYGLRFYSEIAARNKGVKKRRAKSDPQAV